MDFSFFLFMANRGRTLDARLQRLQDRRASIRLAATQRPQLPREEEKWWPALVEQFGSEEAVFERNYLDRRVFDEALALVSDIQLESRGRRSAIQTPRERLLFLFIYMACGVDVLERLVARFIKKREYIHKMARRIAKTYRVNLVQPLVRFLNEEHPDVPEAALVVDCTVCQIRRPKQPFEDAKVFFSGKHFIYAVKKEVFVNIRSGTAALVSRTYPGAVHDITILRSHADEVRELLGGRGVLADLGYVGAERDVPGLIVCGHDMQELRARRVVVECYFGRLKGMWDIFSSKWTLDEKYFDRFFEIGCALTNIHILNNPLVADDFEFNLGINNKILIDLQEKALRQKMANEAYRRRRLRDLEDTTTESTE